MLLEDTPIEAIEDENKLIGFNCCGKIFSINHILKRNTDRIYFEIKIYEKMIFPNETLNEVLTFNLFTDDLTDIVNEDGHPLCASEPTIALFIAEKSVLNSLVPKINP